MSQDSSVSMDLRNRKGDKNNEKKQKTLENVLKKPVDSDGIHLEAVPEQEAHQQEELQAEPVRESKSTKDHLKRFEQKLDLILDRISVLRKTSGKGFQQWKKI